MQTFKEMHDKCGSCAYWGDRGRWYVVLGRSRNSDSIEECNFLEALKLLGGEGKYVAIERESHWAVGWVEHLLINPRSKKSVRIANEIHEKIENYPILNEDRLSQYECDKYYEYAERELKSFENWQNVLRLYDELENLFIGDESSEYAVIEAAREHLEGITEEEYLNLDQSVIIAAYAHEAPFINSEDSSPFPWPFFILQRDFEKQGQEKLPFKTS